MLCAQRRSSDGFGRITEIDQATIGLITHRAKLLDLRLDVARHQFRREPRKGAEINQGRLDTDREHGLFRHAPAPFPKWERELWPTLRWPTKFQHHGYDTSPRI